MTVEEDEGGGGRGEIPTSANNIDSDVKFILRGKSFIHFMNNTGPIIVPWGPPCFNVTQAEKKIFSFIR